MTRDCRSKITSTLNLAIRSLESGYEVIVGDDYMDDLACAYTLDHLRSVRDAISPPFISQDENGDFSISDPSSDYEDQLDSFQELLSLLMERIAHIERKLEK